MYQSMWVMLTTLLIRRYIEMVFKAKNHCQILVVEAVLIKSLPVSNITQSTLSVPNISSRLILRSKSGNLRDFLRWVFSVRGYSCYNKCDLVYSCSLLRKYVESSKYSCLYLTLNVSYTSFNIIALCSVLRSFLFHSKTRVKLSTLILIFFDMLVQTLHKR